MLDGTGRDAGSTRLGVSTESAFTSLATTANPRPADPARAASILAFESEQIGLLGNGGDQVDDIADFGRGRSQSVEAVAGDGGGAMDLVGQRARVADLAADLAGRGCKFPRSTRYPRFNSLGDTTLNSVSPSCIPHPQVNIACLFSAFRSIAGSASNPDFLLFCWPKKGGPT